VQVEVFSDVVCPWCYIGKRRLEEALEQFPHAGDVTVTFRSFQLDPTTPKDVTGTLTERLADKYGVPLEQAKSMNERVTGVASSVGLDFHLDDAHPANTLDAHRLLHFAAAHGKQAELKERLMRAYFTDGEILGDSQTLVRLAAEVGLDEAEAREVLAGDAYATEVAEDLSLARSFGISAVPFFVLDRKYGISGAQETAVLRQALEQAWSEANPLTMVSAGSSEDATGSEDCSDGSCAV
jgi:predicted DsbA family dithiol-disulfide isomerase